MSARVVIRGAKGRMGQALLEALNGMPALRLAAAVDVGDDLAAAVAGADVVVDFTLPEATGELLDVALAAGARLVIGTTGHPEELRARIADAAKTLPVVFSPNFSIGVNLLFWLAGHTATVLGDGFDIEIVEMHHRHKKDAPSGTARRLAEVVAAARGLDYGRHARHGREGLTGARGADEIGVHALRGGDVVGDHTVVFAADGERVELAHKASSRLTFARGALRAAEWLMGQPPGLYDMQDVLGLRRGSAGERG